MRGVAGDGSHCPARLPEPQHGVHWQEGPHSTSGIAAPVQVAVHSSGPQVNTALVHASLHWSSQTPSPQPIAVDVHAFVPLQTTVHACSAGQSTAAPTQAFVPVQDTVQSQPSGHVRVFPTQAFASSQTSAQTPSPQLAHSPGHGWADGAGSCPHRPPVSPVEVSRAPVVLASPVVPGPSEPPAVPLSPAEGSLEVLAVVAPAVPGTPVVSSAVSVALVPAPVSVPASMTSGPQAESAVASSMGEMAETAVVGPSSGTRQGVYAYPSLG